MEQLRAGDPCRECLAQGRDHKLRLFYLNLEEEQLLKCEARTCLWPHNDEVSSDEEEVAAPPLCMPPAPQQSLPSLLDDLPAEPPTNSSWEESPIPFDDPQAVDDDEFIRQLLQQLTPATETSSAESAREPKLNFNSLHDEVKPRLEPQLPDLSSKLQKDTLVKAEIPLLPAKLLPPPPKLQLLGRQNKPKTKPPAQTIQLKAKQEFEIPLQPAKLMTPPSPKGDPFITSPQKASTVPRSPTAAPFNIIISIPEVNPTKSFMDAVSRHSAAAKPAARGGWRSTTRPAVGRRPRAQAVMQMIEQMETTADAKQTS